ncbi:MAG: hypothetical protein AABW50_02210 [Nanoarchaeota archaeon]
MDLEINLEKGKFCHPDDEDRGSGGTRGEHIELINRLLGYKVGGEDNPLSQKIEYSTKKPVWGIWV